MSFILLIAPKECYYPYQKGEAASWNLLQILQIKPIF